MKYLIISGNPKKDGLCYSLTEEVKRGAAEGGAEVEVLTLEKLERCHVCGDGWGTCREKHVCAFGKMGLTRPRKKYVPRMLFVLSPRCIGRRWRNPSNAFLTGCAVVKI